MGGQTGLPSPRKDRLPREDGQTDCLLASTGLGFPICVVGLVFVLRSETWPLQEEAPLTLGQQLARHGAEGHKPGVRKPSVTGALVPGPALLGPGPSTPTFTHRPPSGLQLSKGGHTVLSVPRCVNLKGLVRKFRLGWWGRARVQRGVSDMGCPDRSHAHPSSWPHPRPTSATVADTHC